MGALASALHGEGPRCGERTLFAGAVAFAPESCRNEPIHGMVLVSLTDGNTRFGIGAGNWRWSDLLGLRGSR